MCQLYGGYCTLDSTRHGTHLNYRTSSVPLRLERLKKSTPSTCNFGSDGDACCRPCRICVAQLNFNRPAEKESVETDRDPGLIGVKRNLKAQITPDHIAAPDNLGRRKCKQFIDGGN